uniref:Uncharacterized protein n=1 Tax=Rhizophora mucronata TaxID=61149 RepID=A0A2P2QI45_RHIMU
MFLFFHCCNYFFCARTISTTRRSILSCPMYLFFLCESILCITVFIVHKVGK